MRKPSPRYKGPVDRGMLLTAAMTYLRDCHYVECMWKRANQRGVFTLLAVDGGKWTVSIKRAKQ